MQHISMVIIRIQNVVNHLPRDSLIVGQAIEGDISWLKLQQGVHFAEKLDLADVFKSFNAKYGNYSYHSQQHEAAVLLNINLAGRHDPRQDAIASIKLYDLYKSSTPQMMQSYCMKLLAVHPTPSYAKSVNFVHEGVCLSAFGPKTCICGQKLKDQR